MVQPYKPQHVLSSQQSFQRPESVEKNRFFAGLMHALSYIPGLSFFSGIHDLIKKAFIPSEPNKVNWADHDIVRLKQTSNKKIIFSMIPGLGNIAAARQDIYTKSKNNEMIRMVREGTKNFDDLPQELKEDSEFILDLLGYWGPPDGTLALVQSIDIFKLIPERMQKDEDFLLRLIDKTPACVQWIETQGADPSKFWMKVILKYKDVPRGHLEVRLPHCGLWANLGDLILNNQQARDALKKAANDLSNLKIIANMVNKPLSYPRNWLDFFVQVASDYNEENFLECIKIVTEMVNKTWSCPDEWLDFLAKVSSSYNGESLQKYIKIVTESLYRNESRLYIEWYGEDHRVEVEMDRAVNFLLKAIKVNPSIVPMVTDEKLLLGLIAEKPSLLKTITSKCQPPSIVDKLLFQLITKDPRLIVWGEDKQNIGSLIVGVMKYGPVELEFFLNNPQAKNALLKVAANFERLKSITDIIAQSDHPEKWFDFLAQVSLEYTGNMSPHFLHETTRSLFDGTWKKLQFREPFTKEQLLRAMTPGVDFLLKAFQVNPSLISLVEGKEYLLLLLAKDPSLLDKREDLKNDKGFLVKVVERNPEVLKHIPLTVEKDRDFVLQAVRTNPKAIDYVPEEFFKDKDFAGKLREQNPG